MRKVVYILLIISMLAVSRADCTRIKDFADLQGVRNNQLVGYGLVVGLDDTGDSSRNGITMETLANMMDNIGLTVDREELDVDNVAAVMITAQLPPFAKTGSTIDVQVSSIGDADSLLGGTLLRTPLRGPDNKVYAVAQGPVLVGGLAFSGQGASVQKNHPTVGRIPDGALVEREVPFELPRNGKLTYRLKQSDFTTASRMVKVINKNFGQGTARALDSGSVQVSVPGKFRNNKVRFISLLEKLHFQPDSKARIVVNEKTGTIVMGEDVRLAKVAVSHGNLKLLVKESAKVSQPEPFSEGETVAVPETGIQVQEEEGGDLVVMEKGVSIGDVAGALNAIGATPRDMIAIFQAIKAAGALHAELVIL